MLEILRVVDEVLQPVERQLERLRLHGEALLAGARQELRDVARQPHVAAARPPSAECARGILHLEDARDRIFDPLSELAIGWQPSCDGELVGIEQRQRAAGHLLGTTVRIAVELRQQPRNIQPSRLPNADRHPGQAGDEVG